MSQPPLISVVVPCFNESGNIPELYERTLNILKPFASSEVLFIDDGSSDSTWQEIGKLAAKDSTIAGIRLMRNFGHQMALACGLERVRGERVLVIDADLQDPPELLAEMMQKMDAGFDVVYGQRRKREGETYCKKLSSWFFYRILNRLSEVQMPNDTGDFRLMKREVVKALCALPERVRYTRGLVSWLGFSSTSVEYTRNPRYSGSTNYSLIRMLSLASDGITSFSTRPLQLATWLGAMMMVMSILLLGYVFMSWLFFDTVRGWTSLAAIFLLSQAFQWLMLGIIGNYIAVIFREIKSRPLYLVRDTINLQDH